MKKHEILSPQSRIALFDSPTDPATIVRHYTFSPDDMLLIRRRRRDANRLGFAIHLAYLRFPGRVLGAGDIAPHDMVAFIADQIGHAPAAFNAYAQRDETRRAHLGELQAYLGVRAFRREDYRAVANAALEEATGTDRGDAIVAAMINYLRHENVLLPASITLEKIGLAARARARKQAHKNLVEGLEHKTIAGLEALIAIESDQDRTPLTWMREWAEAPTQKNLAGIVERLQTIRNLGVGADREQRIHRARYAAIARETAINLAVAAITLWNTVYLGRVVDQLRSQSEVIDDAVLAHIAPLGWEHITFNGDYVWPTEPIQNAFRPLRNPRSAFLDPP